MLALILALLLLPATVFAQGVGIFQAAPGVTGRSVCTDITNPVANRTWCADGNNNPLYTWKVWDGTQYVTISGGGGGAIALNNQSWTTFPSQFFANDTNVTITSAGGVHTLGMTGCLPVSRGGLGLCSGIAGFLPLFDTNSTVGMSILQQTDPNTITFHPGSSAAQMLTAHHAGGGAGALFIIKGGDADTGANAVGGILSLRGGDPDGANAGGGVEVFGRPGSVGGTITITAGTSTAGDGGFVGLTGGTSSAGGHGGDAFVSGGPAVGAFRGGNVNINPGTGTPSGNVIINGLKYPLVDGTVGQVITTDGAGALSFSSAAGGITGTGTANRMAKFTGATAIGDSSVTDDGSTVAITISKVWTWDGDVQTIGNACAGANTVCGLVVDALNGAIYGGDGVSTTGAGVGTVIFGSGSAATGSPVAAFTAGIGSTVSADHSVAFSATVSGTDSFGFKGTVSGNNSVLFDIGAGATVATNNTFTVAATGTPELVVTSGNVALNALNYPTTDGANGDCLVTDGAGNLSFSPCPGGGGGGNITTIGGQAGPVITTSNDTNVTLTWAANNGALGWTGTLSPTRGGTGQNTSAWSALPLVTAGTWSQFAGSACPGGQAAISISASGVLTCAATGTGTVTHTAGALTLGVPVIGNGGGDIKTFASPLTNTVYYSNGSSALASESPFAYFDSQHTLVLGVGSLPGSAAWGAPRIFVNQLAEIGTATGATGPVLRLQSTNGAITAPTASAVGNLLGTIDFRGFDGTNGVSGAAIRTVVQSAVSPGIVPTNMVFETTNVTGVKQTPLTLRNTGNVIFGRKIIGYNGLGATDGALLIGNGATAVWDANTLTAGPGITITNGPGSIQIATTGTPGNCAGGGRVVLTDAATDAVVTFSSPMATATYAMASSVIPGPGATLGLPYYVKDVTVNGFTVVLTNAPGLGKSTTVAWIATPSTCIF